jgi:hypothetical protein
MVKRFIPTGDGHATHLKRIVDAQSVAKNLEHKKVRGSLYASDFGQCPRKVWLQHFADEFPPDGDVDARTARIFANGDAVHERLGAYLHADPTLNFVDEINVPRDELDVHGRCDGLATIHDQELVVEFKSINKATLSEPKYEHVGQVSWYMYQFTRLRADLRAEFGVVDVMTEEDFQQPSAKGRLFTELSDVEKRLLLSQGDIVGELIYELKSTQHTVHFPVEYDESRCSAIYDWFAVLKHQVAAKTLPMVKYDAGKFPCGWGRGASAGRCSFWEYCHGSKSESLIQLGKDVGLQSPIQLCSGDGVGVQSSRPAVSGVPVVVPDVRGGLPVRTG